jgi:hypothetical protein
MTLNAIAICSGVTAMPCPMEIEPIDDPDQSEGSSMKPACSLGNPTVVTSTSPN